MLVFSELFSTGSASMVYSLEFEQARKDLRSWSALALLELPG